MPVVVSRKESKPRSGFMAFLWLEYTILQLITLHHDGYSRR